MLLMSVLRVCLAACRKEPAVALTACRKETTTRVSYRLLHHTAWAAQLDIISTKHISAPREKCPLCVSPWGPLGDTPRVRNETFLGPYRAPEGTNTKVTSAKGYFCAYRVVEIILVLIVTILVLL